MKPVLLTVLLTMAAVTATAADAAVAGEWRIERNAMGNTSRQVCTFTQKDTELKGTCSTDNGKVPLAGKVEGDKITWTYKSDSQGGPVTVVYNGTVDTAGKMSGSVTAVEFSVEGEFTATRSK